jgi:uncharacterized membrane protein
MSFLICCRGLPGQTRLIWQISSPRPSCFSEFTSAFSGTPLRDRLVAAIGEKPYRGLFTVASLGGLIWLAMAYSRSPHVPLWSPLVALEPLALPLVLIALLFIVIGLATPSPTTAGMESRLAGDVPARGVSRITRHPFLWGTALWALVHLAVNGDAASLVLFGSLLLLAAAGTASIDAKRRRNFGEQWERFARQTSNVPFAAILSGRNQLRPALREIGLVRPLAGVAVFIVLLLLHERLFGVPAT